MFLCAICIAYTKYRGTIHTPLGWFIDLSSQVQNHDKKRQKCQKKFNKIGVFVRQSIVKGRNPFELSASFYFCSSAVKKSMRPRGQPCERSAQIAISHLRSWQYIVREGKWARDLCRKRVTHIMFYFFYFDFLFAFKNWVGDRAPTKELATGSRLGFSTWLSFCARIRLILRSVQKVKNNWTLCERER